MEAATIFICYSRKDSSFAVQLATDLRNYGHNIWIDQLNIKPGLTWDTEVEKALKKATTLIVILSTESVQSDNVQDEIAFAREERKHIIPIQISSCSVPYRLIRLQRIDFIGNYNEGFKNLLGTLKQEDKEAPDDIRYNTWNESQSNASKNVIISSQDGFINSEGITQLVVNMSQRNETVFNQLLIFKTSDQHTWLIATNKKLFCLLDDENTRKEKKLLMWSITLEEARAHIEVKPHKKNSGLLDIGSKKNWLYSTVLFPKPADLVKEINKLIYKH